MDKRILKIEPFEEGPPPFQRDRAGSQIRLKGQWLKAAGFHPGASVSVESEHAGIIIIRLNNAVEMTAADPEFQRVCAGLDAACATVDQRKGGQS